VNLIANKFLSKFKEEGYKSKENLNEKNELKIYFSKTRNFKQKNPFSRVYRFLFSYTKNYFFSRKPGSCSLSRTVTLNLYFPVFAFLTGEITFTILVAFLRPATTFFAIIT